MNLFLLLMARAASCLCMPTLLQRNINPTATKTNKRLPLFFSFISVLHPLAPASLSELRNFIPGRLFQTLNVHVHLSLFMRSLYYIHAAGIHSGMLPDFRIIEACYSLVLLNVPANRWNSVATSLRSLSVQPAAANHSDCQPVDSAPVSVRLPAHFLLAVPVAARQPDVLLWNAVWNSGRFCCSGRCGCRCRRRCSRSRRRSLQCSRSPCWYLGNHARSPLYCHHGRHSTVLPGLLRG